MSKKNIVCCPKCNNLAVTLVNKNRKIFTAGGAGLGSIIGFFAKQTTTRAGIALGATVGSCCFPGVGTATGATIGGIAGAITGMITGAALGKYAGRKLDEIVSIYQCLKCGYVFDL